MGKRISPVIKWSGSKRHVANEISKLFPEHQRYFEPFVGGGSMLPYRQAPGHASDAMPELIAMWRYLKHKPDQAKQTYREMWERLQADPSYYYTVRDEFNKTREPHLFLFLTRTCFNGLIRFNADNQFNVSHHFGRPGIHPDKMDKVITEWTTQYIHDVNFKVADYREILTYVQMGDLVFLDPPYVGTSGQYKSDASNFDYRDFEKFLEELNLKGADWILTLGQRDDYDLPTHLYRERISSSEYSSSFSRMKKTEAKVGDEIYMNYPPSHRLISG